MSTLEFELSASDKQSQTWLKLRQHLAAKLDELRKKNDNPKLGAEDTAALRGQITFAKGILELGEDRPVVETNRE